MQSRRDQVQAYFFVVGRLVAAVVHGRPDVLQQPNRRLNTGTFLGVVVAAVLMGVFGIYGLFVPGGNNSWRQPGAVVMNEATGARYVFLDGRLRPVLNYSSARLAAGRSGDGRIHSVAQSSLSGTPVGQPIGIPGGPDALPASDALDTGPWAVCAHPPEAGQPNPVAVTVLIGQGAERALTDRQALLVRGPDRVDHLVWRGKRHRLPGRTEVEALGYGGAGPTAVTAAWLNPLPQGRDLAVPETPGTGQPGPVIDGRRSVVGQVYRVGNPALGTDQLYLVRGDGVAPLTRTGAALLLTAPFTGRAYPGASARPVEVGPAALTGVPVSGSGPDLAADLPPEPPELVQPSPEALACAHFTPGGTGQSGVAVGLLPAAVVTAKAVPVAAHVAGTTADRVSVPAGRGVLLRDRSGAGVVHLVTETGVRYPLADTAAVSALGYSEQAAVPVDAGLLALLPPGPLLSTEGALRTRSTDDETAPGPS
ncbi:type VII secretion protein EccB [Actinosynnema sp. NPDC050436]|uniref:type VII secretion protein EccB n=1 Tax=Actinosynnema sp. NPDC050436 TaxID=3155659 RepID=UPI0033F7290D